MRALRFVEALLQKRLLPDVIIYNAGISACGKGRITKRALQVFEEMRQKGLQPDVITYSAVISACGKGGPQRGPCSCLRRCSNGTPAQ